MGTARITVGLLSWVNPPADVNNHCTQYFHGISVSTNPLRGAFLAQYTRRKPSWIHFGFAVFEMASNLILLIVRANGAT